MWYLFKKKQFPTSSLSFTLAPWSINSLIIESWPCRADIIKGVAVFGPPRFITWQWNRQWFIKIIVYYTFEPCLANLDESVQRKFCSPSQHRLSWQHTLVKNKVPSLHCALSQLLSQLEGELTTHAPYFRAFLQLFLVHTFKIKCETC